MIIARLASRRVGLDTASQSVKAQGLRRMKTALFLCTGNYYRSRFAEEFFNHRATLAGINWVGRSRALAIERLNEKIGMISRIAVKALNDRACAIHGVNRPPQQCTIVDLRSADHIVAMDKFEHRPLLRERFPSWEQRAEYWEIGDIGVTPPELALADLEARIEALIRRLPRC